VTRRESSLICHDDAVGGGGTELYELGDQVGLAVQFGTQEDPVDPARVMISVRDPAGRTAQLRFGGDEAVVRVAPGSYQVVLAARLPGRWRYRFVGYGKGLRAEHEGYFDVFDLATD
jgi:hypothetical protein